MTTKREDYLSWDEYFMAMAKLSGLRSKDPNCQMGAVVINPQNKNVATGYNGFPVGCSNDALPWAKEGKFLDTKYPYMCHAELNAILNASTSLRGCRIYVPRFPCHECAKAIIQSGIIEVIYTSDKHWEHDSATASRRMLDMAGVQVRQFKCSKIIYIDLRSEDD